MRLAGICLVTEDVVQLGNFYSELFKIEKCGDSQHTYFQLENFHISICSTSVEETIAPGYLADRGRSRNIIEVAIEDIDSKYNEITKKNYKIVKEIKTEVWGIRSFWIEDIDGNIINFCCNMNIWFKVDNKRFKSPNTLFTTS